MCLLSHFCLYLSLELIFLPFVWILTENLVNAYVSRFIPCAKICPMVEIRLLYWAVLRPWTIVEVSLFCSQDSEDQVCYTSSYPSLARIDDWFNSVDISLVYNIFELFIWFNTASTLVDKSSERNVSWFRYMTEASTNSLTFYFCVELLLHPCVNDLPISRFLNSVVGDLMHCIYILNIQIFLQNFIRIVSFLFQSFARLIATLMNSATLLSPLLETTVHD